MTGWAEEQNIDRGGSSAEAAAGGFGRLRAFVISLD